MKCKEFENDRSCPWKDTPDFDNSWCENCPSFVPDKKEKED